MHSFKYCTCWLISFRMDGFSSISLNSVPTMQHFSLPLRSFNPLIGIMRTPPRVNTYLTWLRREVYIAVRARQSVVELTPLSVCWVVQRLPHFLQPCKIYVWILGLEIPFFVEFKFVRQVLVRASSSLYLNSSIAIFILQRHDHLQLIEHLIYINFLTA